MTKIGVVGSRSFTNKQFLTDTLDSHLDIFGPFILVSGGASGADSMAEQWADDHGLQKEIYPADWEDLSQPDAVIKTRADGKKYDALAGHRRNSVIVKESDFLLAFWDRKSPGTRSSVEKAKKAGKSVYIYWKE
jgi:hypothetical protein